MIPFEELQRMLAADKPQGVVRLSAACLHGALASKGAAALTDTAHWPVIDWDKTWRHGSWIVTSPNPFRAV